MDEFTPVNLNFLTRVVVEIKVDHLHTAGFFSLDITDSSSSVILCQHRTGGAVLGIVGCIAASLVSTHSMPVATPPNIMGQPQTVSRHCQMFPGEACLRTAELDSFLCFLYLLPLFALWHFVKCF